MTSVSMAEAQPAEGAADDRALLDQLRDGNDEAATRLYAKYAERLRALARDRTSDALARRLDADDVVQSVFRVFFDGASRGLYDVPAGAEIWKLLVVIALNKIRAAAVYHQAAKRDVRATAELAGLTADQEPTRPDHRRELELVVQETLARLPAAERAVLELRLHGYEVGEIAERRGCSKRTVERALQQARERLRQYFDEDSRV
jgi:RNA polymerase sigma-70 factor, ECF subfamily